MGGFRVTGFIVLTLCALAAVSCGDADPVAREVDEEISVVMARLLRFHERAEGLEEDLSGREAYRRYSGPLLRVAEERGGRLVWSGSTGPLVIGESQAPFHEMAVVGYPSQEVYLEVVHDPRVVANEAYREAGLECQWLIPATTQDEISAGASPGNGTLTGKSLRGAAMDDPVPECPEPTLGVYPSPQALLALLKPPNDIPVVMVNLLRFKEWTEALGEGMTGAEAYALYGEQVLPLLEEYGCHPIWSGRVQAPDGQSGNGGFHAIALPEYPSDRGFLQVVSDPRMAEITRYRAAGLEGQWLIPGTSYD
jgi:uncharacterized protein (DUF1330 family)